MVGRWGVLLPSEATVGGGRLPYKVHGQGSS